VKVMHVIIGLEVGGAERMLSRLVLAQQKTLPAAECTVVSLTDLGPLGMRLSEAGVSVVALEMRVPLGLLMVVWHLRNLMLQLNPDVVQTWMPHGDLLGGLAARWAGIPKVVWGIRATSMTGASLATRLMRRLCALLSYTVPTHIVSAAEASQRSHGNPVYRDFRAALQKKIDATGLPPERICLLGRTNDPWTLMAQSNAFVLASDYEGFPNALLEAVALGLPSVSTDCGGGVRDISEQGTVVRLVPTGDLFQLQLALSELMRYPGLRLRLGRDGAASVHRRFSLETTVLTMWDALFAEVCQPRLD
jgi:hypothetical protein